MTIRRARVRRRRVACLLVVIALAAVGCEQLLAPSLSTAPAPVPVRRGEERPPRSEHRAPPRTTAGALGEADGALPDGTTPFDDRLPGVGELDPALLGALRRAATDAADEGVELRVDSGWRSARYQQQLLDEAVVEHGSAQDAARWVATPDRSAHVSGDAVDVGPSDAAAWLSVHGAEHGLCQVYGNEPWHFELRPRAALDGCPATYADPTQDPRLRP
jgi:hypothetical protein